MTQELVIGVLLTGLVGLIWAMTVALFWGDQPVTRDSGKGSGTICAERPQGRSDSGTGSGTICAQRPEGRSDKWFLTPSELAVPSTDKDSATGSSLAA